MSTDLEVIDQNGAPVTLFRSDEPDEIIARATQTAGSLAKVVRAQNLAVKISGREHVRVEGWTLLGTLLGVFPYLVWSRPTEDGWEARCEARTIDGRVVGSAEALCSRDEKTWKNRDDYALRSMAQTRATSKAMRQPLGFVMALAGFDPTPAEEMPRGSKTVVAARGADGSGPVPETWDELKTWCQFAGVAEEERLAAAKKHFGGSGRTPSTFTADEIRVLYDELLAGLAVNA